MKNDNLFNGVLPPTVVLGDVVKFEKLMSETDAWLCTKDNLRVFSPYNRVGIKPKQKPNSEPNAYCC
jgi:hypothetical protein